MSKVYVGPASPTSWPAGPLMPVRSSNAKVTGNGDDPSHAHRFVPPFSVVVGCPENTAKNMPHDGFHRVTACYHTFMEEPVHENIALAGVAYEGLPDVGEGIEGEFAIVTSGPATVSYPYDQLKRTDGSEAQIGDYIYVVVGVEIDFTIKGDMPGFQRLKLIAIDAQLQNMGGGPDVTVTGSVYPLLGRLLAWSAHACEATSPPCASPGTYLRA